MKCNRMDELLPDYLLGDTDETTKAEVRSHLEECAGCREEVESLDFIWSRLAAWPEEKAPEGMRARFYGMLEGYKEGLAPAFPPLAGEGEARGLKGGRRSGWRSSPGWPWFF